MQGVDGWRVPTFIDRTIAPMTFHQRFLILLLLLSAAPAIAQASLNDRINDLRHATAIRLAIALDPDMRNLDINVTAAGGTVILSGLVPTLGERDRLVRLVRELPDVSTVRSTVRLNGNPHEELPEPVSTQQDEEVTTSVEPLQTEGPRESDNPPPVYYTVSRGDTLYGIARRYATTLEEITRLNDLNSTTLRIGQRLRVK